MRSSIYMALNCVKSRLFLKAGIITHTSRPSGFIEQLFKTASFPVMLRTRYTISHFSNHTFRIIEVIGRRWSMQRRFAVLRTRREKRRHRGDVTW
jgi:hypothetical protein